MQDQLDAQLSAAANSRSFPGFRQRSVKTSGAVVNTLVGGDGPLLLHGYPKTHLGWHKVGPEAALDALPRALDPLLRPG